MDDWNEVDRMIHETPYNQTKERNPVEPKEKINSASNILDGLVHLMFTVETVDVNSVILSLTDARLLIESAVNDLEPDREPTTHALKVVEGSTDD